MCFTIRGHQPDTLILNTNVRCQLRLGVTDNPIKPTGDKLQGGALWGFESANIYQEVTNSPKSSSARLIDPYFSSLGGGGHLKASFVGDKTSLYSDSDFGRAYSYTVERIGRIGVFWNKAKHVIVYKRSVLPSEQFVNDQTRFAGRPVLRKYDEYVEILEACRHYPESGKDPRWRGFVLSCEFPQGARYRVKSAWGADVGTDGWKVPLWNEQEGSNDSSLYPKPRVTLEMASLENGEESATHIEIQDPQNLMFFTSTKSGTTADTDAWEAVNGIDLVNLPSPAPSQSKSSANPNAVQGFRNGDTHPVVAADSLIPAGFDPVLFAWLVDGHGQAGT